MKTKYFLFLLLFLAVSSTAQNLDKMQIAALDSLFKSYRKMRAFITPLQNPYKSDKPAHHAPMRGSTPYQNK